MTLNDKPERERNPFFEAVGRVTVAGAELDAGLHHLLMAITLEPTLLMYMHGESTSKLIDACRFALKVGAVEEADAAEIKACLDRADKLRIRRNDIVHSLYSQAESGEGIEAMKAIRKAIGYKATTITVEEMETVANDVTVLRSDMFRAGWNAGAAQRPGMDRIAPRRPGEKVNGIPT